MKADALRGHLDALLLAVVADGPKHGYAILEALKERSDEAFDLQEGTAYPALHRLERAGLLSSSWTEAGGRRRRVYVLTTEGRAHLKEQTSQWQRFATAVSQVLTPARKPGTARS